MKHNFENISSNTEVKGVKQVEKPENPENPEVGRLDRPIERILEKIMGRIERGEYDLIIGVDASGRVPMLIFKKVINYLYQKLGHKLPQTIFLAGADMSLGDQESAPRFLEGKQKNTMKYINKFNPKRVLIVEDTIVMGSSIKFMCDILSEGGVPFDVVSISSYQEEDDLQKLKKYLGAENIYVGTGEWADIYGSSHLSGVIKEKKKTFSKPYKQGKEQVEQEDIQRKINQARKDVDIVADHIINWYESQKREDRR